MPIGAAPRRPDRFTVDEYARMLPGFDRIDANIELDHGSLVRISPAQYPHSRILASLLYALRDSLLAAGSPLRVHPELSINLGSATIRTPDIAVIDEPGDEPDFIDARMVRLAVEVSNGSLAYDLGQKAIDYAQIGIADYWVVDALARAVHLHTDPGPGGYARRRIVRLGEELSAACLPTPLVVSA